MKLTVERSPANVTWLVKCNGYTIEVCQRKSEANHLAKRFADKYGLEVG